MTQSAEWATLHPTLTNGEHHLITKQAWGAFTGTGLDAHLRSLGVTQVVLTGIATSLAVESTARTAHEHGYHVTLVTDAMADRDAAVHQNSITRIFPRLGETGSTDDLLRLVGPVE
jgi:nicotinamidase-related amidase